MFSRRSAVDRTPNRLAMAMAERSSKRPLHDLTLSNPTRAGLAYPAEELREALAAEGSGDYDPRPFGLPLARRAVADLLRVPTERVILTASTSEAYALLLKLLCDAGDRVLAPQPSYPLHDLLARFEGVEVDRYETFYDGRWAVDTHGMGQAVTPRTRAVLAVSPNNPTGAYLGADELDTMLGLDLPVIVDEVFHAYPQDEQSPPKSAAEHQGQGLVFTLGGLSKLTGMPQLKLAWIAIGGPSRLVEEASSRLELLADTYLSVATPVQLALPRLLDVGTSLRRRIRERTATNLAVLRDRLDGTGASVLRVEGGWYAVVRLPRVRSEEEWVLELLRAGVLVHPGWFYDFPDEPFVVISLLPEPPCLKAGATVMADRVG